ncbi:unnamed protein product [Paramecium sonneborni]|uniref:Uncharacterized protein n=1 Tax=Paramecium sonneborni TaxID=65129 RepID=A0A8S1LIZ5_9CILI|nr:unnamed protein product [Paramecium sonneborni]
MKTLIIITLILICHSQNGNETRELEIGVIEFEEAKGSQIYNQLVRFDNPFTKIPQVALALVEHTSTTALFAKVKNITQNEFIIQFFSAVTLNATYRYLATTDEEVYINCSNFRASQQAIFNYPQFQQKVEAIAFLVGYHHNGFVNISINQNKNTQVKLQINTNDVQQTAIGMCLIIGSNLQLDEQADAPKFSGRVSSQGHIRSLSFSPSIFQILLIEVQQNSGQANQNTIEPLIDLKTFFDQSFNNQNESPLKNEQNIVYSDTKNQLQIQIDEQFKQQKMEESELLSVQELDQEEVQEEISQNISEELSSDDLSEEEDDEYFWTSKEKEKNSSINFELQLTLLQDALKKKPQIQQQTIKELIKKTSTNQKDQKQKTVIKKQKEDQQKNKIVDEQSNKTKENIQNTEPQILNNQEIDMQLQQKESHVKSLKKALKLVDTAQEKELEIIHPQIEIQNQQIQETEKQQIPEVKVEQIQQKDSEILKPTGYQSPLIDDIPKIEEVNQVKQKEKKITQKLDNYMQSFSQDTYTQKVQKKKQEDQKNKIESKEKETIERDQIQLIQLKGQSHSAKVVYEASEESLRKFEEDFERRKQEKMKEIKQQLIPENKPTKVKFLSLVQEDESLRQYKDFFYD